ncbi:probable beta-hexosaminidase fdl [Nilaparvata lugens]|uniref:probable beta-hexosaminidase fdl n=1 Tax=Nilaparvata lugens TaxID=108931 RepID=UPI00193E7230|nr:probable beta-hexosaminidase fdl [Nilaparvata lugens]
MSNNINVSILLLVRTSLIISQLKLPFEVINYMKKNMKYVCFVCSLAAKRKSNFVFSIIGSIVFITMYWNLSSIHFLKQEFRESNEIVRWTYHCDNHTQLCSRRWLKSDHDVQSLQTCQMSCGIPPIWPLPTGQMKFLNRKTLSFRKNNIKFRLLKAENFNVKRLLIGAADIFLSNLKSMPEVGNVDVKNVDIIVTIIGKTNATELGFDIDESYKLEITANTSSVLVSIKSSTFFGARNALETLSQLIWFDSLIGQYRIVTGLKFEDIPAFNYRGIMLDTGSNFIPIQAIKRTLNAMAMNKLNTLHWHMTNEFSYPFCYSDCMSAIYGAASSNKVYTSENILEIINYAAIRGIRVLLEFNNNLDDIGVIWNSIFDAKNQIEKLKYPETKHGIAHKHMNENILSHRPYMIHLGRAGINHFNGEFNSYSIGNGIYNDRGMFYNGDYDVDNQFNLLPVTTKPLGNLPKELEVSNVVVWCDTVNYFRNISSTFDNRNFIAHVSSESSAKVEEKFLNNGYKVIISHSDVWFLNRLPTWSTVYTHRPWQNYTNKQVNKVVGAQVCLWTDNVDENSLDSRLWPNAAAFAEAVWSNSPDIHVELATMRLDVHRLRMVQSGVMAAPIQPQWCSLNPGECL